MIQDAMAVEKNSTSPIDGKMLSPFPGKKISGIGIWTNTPRAITFHLFTGLPRAFESPWMRLTNKVNRPNREPDV
jgi:hypothetical protein